MDTAIAWAQLSGVIVGLIMGWLAFCPSTQKKWEFVPRKRRQIMADKETQTLLTSNGGTTELEPSQAPYWFDQPEKDSPGDAQESRP